MTAGTQLEHPANVPCLALSLPRLCTCWRRDTSPLCVPARLPPPMQEKPPASLAAGREGAEGARVVASPAAVSSASMSAELSSATGTSPSSQL